MSTTLYRYQPVRTPGPSGTDYRVTGPDGEGVADTLTEVAELDGWRYAAVPEGVTPVVPEQVTTWEPVTLTDWLREAIKLASPHCKLARERCVEAIRAHYSIDDELYLGRIATGSLLGTYTLQQGEAEKLDAYQAHVEAARVELQMRYAELGL